MQLYSLQETVKKLGNNLEIEVIDYVPENYSVNSIRNIIYSSGIRVRDEELRKSLHRVLLNLMHQKHLVGKFADFTDKYFSMSRHCNEKNWLEIFSGYDAIIVGSDQVWNPTNQLGDVYFMNDESIDCKRIAYAADSTNSNPVQSRVEDIRGALKKFDAISVRNEHTKEFVANVLGKPAASEIVCDPVMLSEFTEFVKPNKLGDYALVYILGGEIPGGHDSVVNDIRRKHQGIRIIQVVMIKQRLFTVIENIDDHIYECSPEMWVNLIYHSRFVYTDSFHCILFAMKYHKNFLAYYCEEKRAPRLISLRNHYSLGFKIVSSVEEAHIHNSIDMELDYREIDAICKKEADHSVEFIRNALGEALNG